MRVKKLLPSSVSNSNCMDEIKGMYVPFRLFDGTSTAAEDFDATKTRKHRRGNYEVTTTEHNLSKVCRPNGYGGNSEMGSPFWLIHTQISSINMPSISSSIDFVNNFSFSTHNNSKRKQNMRMCKNAPAGFGRRMNN